MRMIDVIIKKRNGRTLTQDEFNFVAQGAAKGTVPDYQLSAFLMACFLRPLSDKETAMFTKAMAHSGGRLDFSSVKMPTVDKHSTGGVGDGISMALAPLVVWGAVFLALNLAMGAKYFWFIYMLQLVNVSGAAGDLYVSFRFLRMPKDILVQDTGVSMTVFTRN